MTKKVVRNYRPRRAGKHFGHVDNTKQFRIIDDTVRVPGLAVRWRAGFVGAVRRIGRYRWRRACAFRRLRTRPGTDEKRAWPREIGSTDENRARTGREERDDRRRLVRATVPSSTCYALNAVGRSCARWPRLNNDKKTEEPPTIFTISGGLGIIRARTLHA